MNKLIDRDKIYKVIKVNKKSIKMLFILTVVAFLWAFFFSSRETTYNLFVWENWDNFITVLTFIVAITIGWLDYVRYWRESLPNKLTVHFVYNEEYIMSAYTVSLSSKSDLRAWAQQIGRQMIGGKSLNFQVTYAQKHSKIVNNQFKHYEVTYYLTTEPEIFQKPSYKNKYLTWVVEDNDNESKGDVDPRKQDHRPSTPLTRNEALTRGEKYSIIQPSNP